MIKYDGYLKKVYCPDCDFTIDILDNVVTGMKKHLQNASNDPESGGVLIGYKVKGRNQIVIENLSNPDNADESSRYRFIRKAKSHLKLIKKSRKELSFCVGNWHTHPLTVPSPSAIDIDTWKKELNECKSSFDFQVYIICGKIGFRVWVGNEKTKQIMETTECDMEDGLYKGVE